MHNPQNLHSSYNLHNSFGKVSFLMHVHFFPVYKNLNRILLKKQRKTSKKVQNLSKEEKTKFGNMVMNDIEIFQKIKNKG